MKIQNDRRNGKEREHQEAGGDMQKKKKKLGEVKRKEDAAGIATKRTNGRKCKEGEGADGEGGNWLIQTAGVSGEAYTGLSEGLIRGLECPTDWKSSRHFPDSRASTYQKTTLN